VKNERFVNNDALKANKFKSYTRVVESDGTMKKVNPKIGDCS
jgi:hypothetical protein